MSDLNNDPAAAAAARQQPVNPDQLRLWARLVADGEAEFPPDLPPDQEQSLLYEVRRLRRARLITFIARQIALDIHRERRTEEDDLC